MTNETKIDWNALKQFIADCEGIKTSQDWTRMRKLADSMNEQTSALAIEHLYLYAFEGV